MNSKLIIKTISHCTIAMAVTIAFSAITGMAQTTPPVADQTASVTGISDLKSEEAPKPGDEPKDEVAKLTPEKVSLIAKPAASGNPFALKTSNQTAAPSRQASSSSDWQFAFTPYLYMTGVTGTIGARGQTAEIDLDFADVFEHLNLGIMGTLEARKGRFITATDLMWIKLGQEQDTTGPLFSSVKLGVNMFVLDPEVGYRLYEGKGGNFDVLGGIRIMSVENNINFRAGTLPAADFSERKTWATPVIGAHGTLNLSPKFFLATKFDVGGGIGADFTGQFYGGAGYRIKPNIALIGGYRYVKTDYDSEAGFVFNTAMNGILVGAKFSF
jgi:hypothetical protein